MSNPYEVLGVPYGSSKERIDAAYRRKAREYSETNQQAKLNELNNAYDTIVMGSSYGTYGNGQSTYTYGSDYSDIRARIQSNRLEDAQVLLDGIPASSRDAEWYYLKGTIYQKKGWLDQASDHFRTASTMNPSNVTYRNAANNAENARNGGYRTTGSSKSGSDCDFCSCCADLLCADACCECMGGDLIPCC